jgi:hypothetical protein
MKMSFQTPLKKERLLFYKMDRNTQANGKFFLQAPKKSVGEECKPRWMAEFMKVIGRTVKRMGAVVSLIQTEIFMTVIGQKVRPAATESSPILTELNTKVFGKMISSMVKDKKYGLTEHNMKETTSSDKKTVLANSSGPINLPSTVTLS